MKKFSILVTFLILFSTIHVFGQTTLRVPSQYATIQEAINAAQNGDTIVVYSGTYYENINFIGKAIWLKSDGGALNTTINGNKAGSCVSFVSGETTASIIDGFTITNGSGTLLTGSQHFGGGIYSYNGSNPTINNCIITGNSAYAGSGGGIGCWYASAEIHNCIIKNNTNHGISNAAGGGVLVVNCLIYGNYGEDSGGGISAGAGSSPTIINSTIVQNDSYSHTNNGIYATSGGTVINSIVRDNVGVDVNIKQGTTTVMFSNIEGGYTGTGNIDVDPLFVDPVNNNYHLSDASPCIGTATSLYAPSTDIEFNPRPNPSGSNPDMGAYENALANSNSLITLIRPNGGESFVAGTVDTVKWASTNVTNVKLEYTTDNGTNWGTIISSTPASSGSYAWTVPNTPSTNCKARISDVANSLLADTSDNIFSIYYESAYDSITYGGKTYHTVKIGIQTWLKENLDIGTMIQVTENPSDNGTIEKYCYDNNPANCTTYGGLYQWNEAMAYSTAPGTRGICPTGWHVPKQAELQTLATAVSYDGNALKAVGQGTGTNTSGFSALLPGFRGMVGGFTGLGYYSYFWSSTEYGATGASNMNLERGSSVNLSQSWKGSGSSVRCLKDENPTASVQIISPNGGESFIVGTVDTIKWSSSNITNIRLEYTTDTGTNWSTIIANTLASSGSYAWTVPNTPSTYCKLKVSDVNNSLLSDTSDMDFSITPSDSGYDTLTYAGKTYHIVKIGTQTWLKENLDVGTRINGNLDQTSNGGSNFIEKYCYNNDEAYCTTYGGLYQWNEAMQYVTTSGAKGICPTSWHIPTKAEFTTLQTSVGGFYGGNALKAIGQGSGDGAGTNTSGFSALLAGADGLDGNLFDLGIYTYFWSSTEGDATYASNLFLYFTDGYINFYNFNKKFGFSVRCLKDENPTASVQIISPNGGENFVAGTVDTIKWSSSNVINIKLEYTTDSGTNWSTIIASTPASSGSYAWTVPNTLSTNCKVKISDVSNSATADVSDNAFTIKALICTYSPDANTVLLMHMDESSGSTISDASSNSFNGTIASGVTFDSGKFGNATVYANQGYFSIPHNAALNLQNITIEMWLYPTMSDFTATGADPGFGLVAKRSKNTTHPYVFAVKNGGNLELHAHYGSWYGTLTNTDVLKTNQWQHVAVTRSVSGSNVSFNFYLNGKNIMTTTAVLGSITMNTEPLWIGKDPYFSLYTNQGTYKGKIDELRISNIARSPQEFNLQLPPKNLAAASSSSAINLTWANGGGAVGLLKYKVYRGADSVNVSLIDSTANTNFSNTGLSSSDKYYYRVSAIDLTGFESVMSFAVNTSITAINDFENFPKEYELAQNFPNPFNPSTVINYSLPFDSKVLIKIYNVLGQDVKLLKDEIISAGNYEVQFNSSSLSSGVYFYRLSAVSLDGKQKYSSIKKMVFLK